MRINCYSVSFSADEFLYHKLKELAEVEHRSVSGFVRHYLRINFFSSDERMEQIKHWNEMARKALLPPGEEKR